MAPRNDVEYIELLIRVSEAATELVEESYCWTTDEKIGCGKCIWCHLADAVDELREGPSS